MFKKYKIAFIINAHAKKVNDKLIEKLAQKIPINNLFYSKSIKESYYYLQYILKKKYTHIVSGGGDGTFINNLNIVRKIFINRKYKYIPKMGVLKLGTGNALASEIKTRNIFDDVAYLVDGKKLFLKKIFMVQCNNSIITPFAGLGYDADVLYDYIHFNKTFDRTPLDKITSSLLGYILSVLFITLPKNFFNFRKSNIAKIVTKSEAYEIITNEEKREEAILYESNEIIYEDKVFMILVGSIKFFGYGLQIFPCAGYHKKFLHLRVFTCTPLKFITNLRQIWSGTFRDPQIKEFLIKDVNISTSELLPYQIGGDFKGFYKNINFKITNFCIQFISTVSL